MTSQTFEKKLEYYLAAAYGLLGVETHEEGRCFQEIQRVAKTSNRKLFTWDCATGLVEQGDKPVRIEKTKAPAESLAHVAGITDPAVLVFLDLHPFLAKDVAVVRQLRNLSGILKQKRQTLILLSPRLNLPVELQKEVQLVEYALPDEAQLNRILDHAIADIRVKYPDFKVGDNQRASIVEAAKGMTSLEAGNAFALSTIVTKTETGKVSMNGEFPRLVFEEKVTNLKNSFLEYVPTKSGFGTIGGMECLKDWARQRRHGFDAAARSSKLPYPRGCLLAGFAGSGKTVSAMAIAAEFDFPLFKLDVGKLFGSKVGESESNVRELLKLMEGLGRAVILIDEIEKSLSESAVAGSGDSGTSSRVFGSLLTWMSLKTCPVFLVGTCNDVDRLPAALQRRGRFDEIWFSDLPAAAERCQIFNVLLEHKFQRKLKLNPDHPLVEKTKDFVGSEIEAAIEDAIYALIDEPKQIDKKLENQLLSTVAGMIPQAQLNPFQVQKLRDVASRGFKRTSLQNAQPVSVGAGGRSLDLN